MRVHNMHSSIVIILAIPFAVAFSPRTTFEPSSTRHDPLAHHHYRRTFYLSSRSQQNTEVSDTCSPSRFLPSIIFAGILAVSSPQETLAFSPDDYASDVVVSAVQSLKDSTGSIEETFKTYENIGSIITEGRGVGGIINYKGVQLDRGYIADEDQSIYNPGLTLLTESEKERLVASVIQSRKDNLSQGQWSEGNQLAYDFLRDKLDPLHVTELRSYLAIFPFYTAAIYLVALAVQQLARDLFPAAYLVGVAAVLAPILILIAAGP
ncbi:hypothetical protein MPSEU_000071300 [Mayamaea pseudoterrestris]|nr:hypothetical protein MPSEU_000071300 [Mayamaea pseudoterrestris]